MVLFKEINVFCIVILLQLQLVYCNWCRGCASTGPMYYVPSSAPPEYTRVVQGYPFENTRQCQPLVPSSGFRPRSGISFPFETASIAGVPPQQESLIDLELYEGQYQAAAAASAHPNQPVIIINNGDYATKKEDGGGADLLSFLLASNGNLVNPGFLPPPPPPPLPPPPPPAYNDKNNSGPININITIIMPKSESECCKNKDDDD